MRAVDVNSQQLTQYVDQRQAEGAANATVNRELALLKRAFSLGFKASPKKVTQIAPFSHLKEANARRGFLKTARTRGLSKEPNYGSALSWNAPSQPAGATKSC